MEKQMYESDEERFIRLTKAHLAAHSRAMNANTMMPPLWLVATFIIGLGVVLWATGGFEEGTGRDRYMTARNLWLADCQKPIESCAADWDRSYTLREIYGEKVPLN